MSRVSSSLAERRQQNIPRGVATMHPLFLSEAGGALVRDTEGKEYIDFLSGIGVNNVGHTHPKVASAIRAQSEKYLHTCFHTLMYEPYIEVAERLNGIVPVRGEAKTMLANSGAEAVENAVKIARAHTGRPAVICFDNAFHGRTMLTMTMTSKIRPNKTRTGAWAPFVYRAHFPYCYRCPWNLVPETCGLPCAESYFEKDIFKFQVDPGETAAVVIEPVQGEGGFIPMPEGYLAALRKLCDARSILLIMDEIQSGFGRSGKMFATEYSGVEPDIMVTAKALGGGMPLSAVTGSAEIMDSVAVGGLGGTYGGNPVCCASALAVMDIFEEEKILEKSLAMGKVLKDRFDLFEEKYPLVGNARGLGPMVALELIQDPETREPYPEAATELVGFCRDNGLLVMACGTFGNNIRLLPPLNIDPSILEKGLAILEKGLSRIQENRG